MSQRDRPHDRRCPTQPRSPRCAFCARVTGRRVGGSTGTNLWGALRLADEMRAAATAGSIVTLICDAGDRYAQTYYDDGWLRASGLDITPYATTLEPFATTGIWNEPA